jgi:hypothetical protein
LTRRRPSGCAKLVPIGKKQSRCKIEERIVTYDVIVVGLGGMGTAYQFYKFASVNGEILADLAIDGSARHHFGLFSPDRLTAPE